MLIADDSQSSRDLLRFILERSGCDVIEAQDGEQALALALEFTPDLFILDLNMPRLDGYSVAAELRKQPAFTQTPILALSAGVTQTDPARIKESGFSAFLSKPIPPAGLRNCISRLL
ncbi:MAG TPA: response regulator [Acidobacteriaceae bacterium]|nr:response regulator [Acidobacteriaceae bacterium]